MFHLTSVLSPDACGFSAAYLDSCLHSSISQAAILFSLLMRASWSCSSFKNIFVLMCSKMACHFLLLSLGRLLVALFSVPKSCSTGGCDESWAASFIIHPVAAKHDKWGKRDKQSLVEWSEVSRIWMMIYMFHSQQRHHIRGPSGSLRCNL